MTNDDQHKLHNICGTSSVARKVSLIRRHVIVFFISILSTLFLNTVILCPSAALRQSPQRVPTAGQQKKTSPSPHHVSGLARHLTGAG